MTDILDHLQPDSPLYEATRDAAKEEIIRLRSQLSEKNSYIEKLKTENEALNRMLRKTPLVRGKE